jgi:rhamnosyltransferase subunit B
MHAILASLGTDGDVLPFIGLGATLRARGHRVTIVAAENYAELIASHWLEFRPLVSTEAMRTLLGNADFWHPLKTARFSAKWGADLIEPQYRLLSELAAETDTVLVTNPAIFAGMLVREKLGHPLATVVLQPWMIPSVSAPPVMPIFGLPLGAPRFLHGAFFRLFTIAANVVGDTVIGPKLNRVRRSIGLKPARRILSNWFSPELIVGMFPDWFGPPPPDWPSQLKLTGFPLFDGVLNRALPNGLPEFLSNSKVTIAFTFGSGMMHGPQLFDMATRMCTKLNAQGLFINRFQSPALPPNMFHTTFAPFREIFPRCAAIVHHGGIGTTAEALAAGRPQLILPLGFDQLDNGVRVQKLGAGLHTASKHNLVAQNSRLSEREVGQLAGAISRLLRADFQEAAQKFASRLRNGLENAADEIELLAARNNQRFTTSRASSE